MDRHAGGTSPGEVTAGPPRRRPFSGRLAGIAFLGLLLVTAAFVFRQTPWAREQQLKRASLTELESWALQSPRDARLQYYLGTAYYNAGEDTKALAAFQRAALFDPKMARARVGLATVLQRAGRSAEAHAAAKQALALDPRSADAQFMVGFITYPASRTRARVEFQQLTKIAPRRAEGWYWLGRCDADRHEPLSAVQPFQRAAELEPKNPVYQRDLGDVLMQLDRHAEARPHLERALDLNDRDPEAAFLLGKLRKATAQSDADLEAAERLMRRSVELLREAPAEGTSQRDFAAVALEWAGILRELRRDREALPILEQAWKADPQNYAILHQMALTARTLGQHERAASLLKEYSRRASAESEMRNLEQRVKQDMQNPPLRLRLARIYARAGDYVRAVNQYDVYLGMVPGQAEAVRERQALLKHAPRASPAQP